MVSGNLVLAVHLTTGQLSVIVVDELDRDVAKGYVTLENMENFIQQVKAGLFDELIEKARKLQNGQTAQD